MLVRKKIKLLIRK